MFNIGVAELIVTYTVMQRQLVEDLLALGFS